MSASENHCPQGYMKIGGKQIIIRERKKNKMAEESKPLTNKNIIIIESNKSSTESIDLNTPPTSPVNTSTPGDEKTTPTHSLASSESELTDSVVTFDPKPPSRTILTKTASPKGTGRPMAVEKVTLTDKSKAIPSEVNKSDAWRKKKQDKDACADVIPRIYKVLPDDCHRRYERLTYLPGVKVVPPNTPSWKVPILQKKNQQVIEEYLSKKEAEHKIKEAERSERERQEAMPDWKKPIVKAIGQKRSLEKQKFFERAQMEKEEVDKFNAMPPWRQELILRKKEQDKLEKLPSWQKDLIIKKRVANTKSTFERAEAMDASTAIPWSKLSLRKTNIQH